MRQNLLLPHSFKTIGWIILVPSLVLGITMVIGLFDPEKLLRALNLSKIAPKDIFVTATEQWSNTILIIGIVIGVLFTACSREKIEDELTSQIRLRSLMLVLYIYFVAVILITLLVYGLGYIMWMTYSVLGFMLLFLAIFRIKMWRLRKEETDEE
jgi:L-asparagine transporter-like permease